MFGAGLEQIIAQLMQQNLMGMQGKQSPPQARFTGPLGHYGLLAQNLAGGAQQTPMQPSPLGKKQIPQTPRSPGIQGLPPGLLGGFY